MTPIVHRISECGWAVTLLGASRTAPGGRTEGGAYETFQSAEVACNEFSAMGYSGHVAKVPLEFAQRLLDLGEPDCVLVGCAHDASGNNVYLEDVIIRAACLAGVQSLQIVDGWDVWVPRKDGSRANNYAAPDKIAQQILISREAADIDHIHITGYPALDAVTPGADSAMREAARACYDLAGYRVVTYFGQVNTNNPETLRWTIDALQPDDRLLFQPHPRDERNYSAVLQAAGDLVVDYLPDDVPALVVADLCLTHHSTVGLRAVSLGLPLINILLDDDLVDVRRLCGGYPLSVLGLSTEVSSSRALREALQSPMRPPERAVLEDALYCDGQATERVIQLIRE